MVVEGRVTLLFFTLHFKVATLSDDGCHDAPTILPLDVHPLES